MRVGSDRWEGIVSTFARADSRDNVHMSYLANTANPNGVRFTPGETMSITDVSMPNKYVTTSGWSLEAAANSGERLDLVVDLPVDINHLVMSS